jgi:pilus assembly protein Flp/PilA
VKSIRDAVRNFLRDETGTETLEWGLICGLVVVGAIAAMTTIGPKVATLWNNVAKALDKP